MARSPKSTQRKRETRESYDKILIVTEGEKTEPFYFQEVVGHYKISSANVRIDGNSRSSPGFVLTHAKKLADEERKQGSPYDKVFIVIDRDDHACFQKTVDAVKKIKGNVFSAVTSIPCFEYWLILHFKCSTKEYISTIGNTAANQALNDLRKQPGMKDYKKKDKGIFIKLLPLLEDAKINSARALALAQQLGVDNPTTSVHDFIHYLQNVKNK
ncbi:RloB family protein [Vibrio fluvialis]|nr:RloB family protein [Vibrio fluvialis]